MVTAVKRPAGETRGKVAAGPDAGQCHRASSRPYSKGESGVHGITPIWADRRTCMEISGETRSPRYKRSRPRSLPVPEAPRAVYPVILDFPLPQVVFVSRLLADHRREIGTRNGTRALTCWKRAVFALAWFRDRPDIRRMGQGPGISQPTAYRYKDEAAEVLAAKAPTLHEALEKAVEQGLPYLILDGTLISSDRCADKKTSRKGKEIDKWYSGKAHRPAGNVQALAAPGGVPLWVSDVLRGSTHDLTAARELVLPEARPYLKDLPVLADSGHEGAGRASWSR
jgi:DDE superfamily endonuclease